MADWLRPLLMMFYAPSRALRDVRDNAPLLPSFILAFLSHAGYRVLTEYLFLRWVQGGWSFGFTFSLVREVVAFILFIAIVFVPLTIWIANLFDRHGSFSLVLRQEYASFASTVFYSWTIAHVFAVPVALLSVNGGALEVAVVNRIEMVKTQQAGVWTAAQTAQLTDPHLLWTAFFWLILLPFLIILAGVAIRAKFGFSWFRATAVLLISGLMTFVLVPFLFPLFNWAFASPFILVILFLFLRGYFGELMNSQRARAAFKQNLEAATLNPADASAHYNLGLIHQKRNELDAARARFERAVEIDPDEVDAFFQLGCIARRERRYADAIQNFEQVVTRDPAHSQNEIWREIGATYLDAKQFADAREALERFLDQRQSDPEALYLMGLAQAGLGRQQEATRSMEACIEAVKSAPAYKYRIEKRWLNEARQFIKSSQ